MLKLKNVIAQLIKLTLNGSVIRATKYISEKEIVRAVRRTYGGKMRGNAEIHLTIGVPNYQEREFIKKAKKAKESFPIKKIQIKYVKH